MDNMPRSAIRYTSSPKKQQQEKQDIPRRATRTNQTRVLNQSHVSGEQNINWGAFTPQTHHDAPRKKTKQLTQESGVKRHFPPKNTIPIAVTLLVSVCLVLLFQFLFHVWQNYQYTLNYGGSVVEYHQALAPNEQKSCILAWQNNKGVIIVVDRLCDRADEKTYTVSLVQDHSSPTLVTFKDINGDGYSDIIVGVVVLYNNTHDVFQLTLP